MKVMMRKAKRQQASIPYKETRKPVRRQKLHAVSVSEHPSPDRNRRTYERETLKIRVRIKTQAKEVSGKTQDMSPAGLRVIGDTGLDVGTPMSLRFCFGGDTCYMTVSGQVVFCRAIGVDVPSKYEIGVKFAAIRGWEQKLLSSAVQVLKEDTVTRHRSLLTILVSEDTLAQEAANLSPKASDSPVEEHYRTFKRGKRFTPHPAWVLQLRQQIEPPWNAILQCRLIQEASAGTLSLQQMQAWMLQLYPFIETFPKWIALNITKTEDPISRSFLIDNVRVEKRHAEQWIYMAEGFGLKRADLCSVKPIPEVDALTHWLWSINSQGTLAEAVAATSYAIEGITHDIATVTVKGFPHYEGREGVHLDRKAYWWMEAHAKYDDLHPQQALEIVKQYATTIELQQRVTFVTRRSLEYMHLALENCYTQFRPDAAPCLTQEVL